MFHTLVYLKNVLYLGLKFKVEFTDGSAPAKGKHMMTLKAVLMNLEMTDSNEELKFRKALAQVGLFIGVQIQAAPY